MRVGHIDNLDQNGVLSGWFINEEGSQPIEFAVSANDAVIAIGARSVVRPDVAQHYGHEKVGFKVKITPTVRLNENSEIRLIELSSMSVIPTNKFSPSEDYLNAPLNSASAIERNVKLLKVILNADLFGSRYIEALSLKDHPASSVARFYLAMVDYWMISPNEWIDAELISRQQQENERGSASPLESLLTSNNVALIPNTVVNPQYLVSIFSQHLDVASINSPYAVLQNWLDLGKRGVLLRPSALFRSGFGEDGIISGDRKLLARTLETLRKISAGVGSFRDLAEASPIFCEHWLRTRPLKASINGSHVIRNLLTGDGSMQPNCYFNEFGLQRFANVAWQMDSGLPLKLEVLASCLHEDLQRISKDGVALDLNDPLSQLREIPVKEGRLDVAFIETFAPSVFRTFAERCKLQKEFEIYRCYLEQLGIPKNFAQSDLSGKSQTLNLDLLRRLASNQSDTIKVSLIIPTLGRLDLLFKVLRSISLSLTSSSIEVLVADDCSQLDVSILAYFFPNVQFVRTKQTLGFLLNVNQAASKANGEYLLLVNNDVIVRPHAIDELIESMESRPDCDVMGGMVLSGDHSVQEIGGAVWSDGSAWNLFRGWASTDDSLPRNIREVDYVSGCWMAIRKSAWKEHGGFSEEFAPAYCEDMDFCLKVWKAGRLVMVNPASIVIHDEGSTMGRDASDAKELKRFQSVNQKRIKEKWRAYLSSSFSSNGNLSLQYRGYNTSKPIALIFDHYCPEPDRDAGSRSVMELIKAVAASGAYYPLFVPANNHYSRYAKMLERLGVEVICGPRGWKRFDDLLANHGAAVGLVLCSRLPVAKQFSWHISKCHGMKIVYIHDVEEIRQAITLGIPEEMAQLGYRSHVEKWADQYKQFDCVLTCSEKEKEGLAKYLSVPIHSFPVYKIGDAPAQLVSGKVDLEMIFVGSVNHPPNMSGVAWFVSVVLPEIRTHIPSARLHLVGSGFESCKYLQQPGVILHGQVSDSTLTYLYSTCAFAIAPLLEGAGMKGKVVEALSQGLPCIGTDVAYQGMEKCLASLPPPLDALAAGGGDTLAKRILKFYKHRHKADRDAIFAALKKGFGSDEPGEVLLSLLA